VSESGFTSGLSSMLGIFLRKILETTRAGQRAINL
jgi:hypothetical protein